MIDKTLLKKNKNITNIEIFIGKPELNMFNCLINNNVFNQMIKLFPNLKKCKYNKYYYKNMIYEFVNNKERIYEKKYLFSEKSNKYLINFFRIYTQK